MRSKRSFYLLNSFLERRKRADLEYLYMKNLSFRLRSVREKQCAPIFGIRSAIQIPLCMDGWTRVSRKRLHCHWRTRTAHTSSDKGLAI